MEKKPLVTIVTATHNGERYLKEAIESVIVQDYPNKEYLIINDASTDKTAEILENYEKKYPWIRIITNDKNLERSLSRNLGIQQAGGDFIAFLDDDDFFKSRSKLSKQVDFLMNNQDYVLVGTNIEVLDQNGNLLDKCIKIRESNYMIKNNILKSNQFILSTVMARKTSLLEVGGFVDGHFLAEDYELRLKLGENGKLANLEEKLTSYRDRDNNTSNNNYRRINFESFKFARAFRNAYPNSRKSFLIRGVCFFLPESFYTWKARLKIGKVYQVFKKFPYDLRHFSFKIACYNFLWSFVKVLPDFNFKWMILEKKNNLIFDFLNSHYHNFIARYHYSPPEYNLYPNKIWCFWWQGEEAAPELIKKCIESFRKWSGTYEVIVLNKKNYADYVQIPTALIKKLNAQKISITHFSDILRMKLLKDYGGVWLDATMFIHSNVLSSFENKVLNSLNPRLHIKKNHQFTKRCIFFIGGGPNITFAFVYDFLVKYYEDYDQLIDFFLTDFVFWLAYEYLPEAKRQLEGISLENNDIFELVNFFNDPYNESTYEKLMEAGYFKLTYKVKFYKYTKEGYLTNYGKFLQEIEK